MDFGKVRMVLSTQQNKTNKWKPKHTDNKTEGHLIFSYFIKSLWEKHDFLLKQWILQIPIPVVSTVNAGLTTHMIIVLRLRHAIPSHPFHHSQQEIVVTQSNVLAFKGN